MVANNASGVTMKPRPEHQRRHAHRQRLALGRAMHQIQRMRWRLLRHYGYAIRLPVPKILRKHAKLLRHTFAVMGS